MEYNIKEKLEWTVIFILEFGRKYGLTMKQSFSYLSRFKGIVSLTVITDMFIHSRLLQW